MLLISILNGGFYAAQLEPPNIYRQSPIFLLLTKNTFSVT